MARKRHGTALELARDYTGEVKGYPRMRRNGKAQFLHCWIWEQLVGPIPVGYEIDHINGNPSDCRLENLRVVPHKINCRNRGKRKDNSSGTTGVYYQKKKLVYYWTAAWNDPVTGKLRTKSFNVDLLGNDMAKKLAIEYRKSVFDSLVNKHSYTNRHGD